MTVTFYAPDTCQNGEFVMEGKTHIFYFIAAGLFAVAGIMNGINSGSWTKPVFGIAIGALWAVIGLNLKKKNEEPKP